MSSSSVPLGDLVDITSGFAFSSKNFSEAKGTPIIRIRDVARGYTELRFDGDFDKKFLAQNDDLLVSMDGEFRVAEWRGGPALINQRVCKIEPKNGKLDRRFLRHFLPKELKEIEDKTPFVTVKHLSAKTIREIECPNIGIDEQRRIAAILDKADAIRRKRQQALALADDFLKSVFLEMFGDLVGNDRNWPTKFLGDHIIHSNNGLARRRKTQENAGSIVLRIQDVKANDIDYSDTNRIPMEGNDRRRFELEVNDLLFVRVNGNKDYVGRCAIFRGYFEPVCHNDHIIRIRFDESFNSEFLSFLFNLAAGRKFLENAIKTSAGQYTISQDGLKSLALPCPSKEQQQAFAIAVERQIKSRQTLHSSEKQSKDLFASLSQRAFRGEL